LTPPSVPDGAKTMPASPGPVAGVLLAAISPPARRHLGSAEPGGGHGSTARRSRPVARRHRDAVADRIDPRDHGGRQRSSDQLRDGETAEGSVWEAAQMAGHDGLANVIAIVDVNALGQSGPTMLGHDLRAYQRRFAAFGWRAATIDGHDFNEIVPALRRARASRQAPTAIIARTVKGQGIPDVA